MEVFLSLVFFLGLVASIALIGVGLIFKLLRRPSKRILKGGVLSISLSVLSFVIIVGMNLDESTGVPNAGQTSSENQTTEQTSNDTDVTHEEQETTTEPVENEQEESESAEGNNSGDITSESDTQEEQMETLQPEDYRTDVTYDNLARNPEEYTGEPVQMSGTIVQIIEGDMINQARVAINDNYDEIVFIEYYTTLLETNVLEDDYITFYGTSHGTISYETVLGAQETIPALTTPHIKLAQ